MVLMIGVCMCVCVCVCVCVCEERASRQTKILIINELDQTVQPELCELCLLPKKIP